jgi:hypothetical protein
MSRAPQRPVPDRLDPEKVAYSVPQSDDGLSGEYSKTRPLRMRSHAA